MVAEFLALGSLCQFNPVSAQFTVFDLWLCIHFSANEANEPCGH